MRNNVVKQLTDIQHVLERPGMYVGDVSNSNHNKWIISKDGKHIIRENIKYTPAILKMFDEIISNSIDEGLRTNFKHANKIKIDIDDDTITVSDNGRGISSSIADGSDKSQAALAFTALRAGSNFGDEKFVSTGTHGLGASIVNILSRQFLANTRHNNIRTIVKCSNNMSDIDLNTAALSSCSSGTLVKFTPDFNCFGASSLDNNHIRLIEKRIYDLAVAFPKIQFKFNGKIIPARKFKAYLNMLSDVYETIETDDYKIAIMHSDEAEQISLVNGLDTYEGGTHVDFARNKIIYAILDKLKRKYKKLGLKPADIKSKLRIVLITNSIKSAKFRSQTKEYLTNNISEFSHIFQGVDAQSFINRIVRHPEIIDPIIETKKLRAAAADAVAVKAAARKVKRLKIAKHIPANGKPHQTILHICEGQSAVGQLCNVRDPNIHGGYPLKGKPLNIFGKKPAVIMANKEYAELMNIIGLEIGKLPTNLNYSKIRIMADADHDGNAIVAQLCHFFAQWESLFDDNIIELVLSPIVTAHKGKQIKRYYSFDDYDADRDNLSEYTIKYNKGLGSLSKSEYAEMLNNPVLKTIKWTSESRSALELVFNDKPEGRKVWLQQ